MAIIETGAIFKSLRFDGVDSRDYGVYITGEAVYNAPERDVEMVTIPGRNGAYALDKGRFNNITVTYPAGLFQKSETDFKTALSDFRNALCSRVGYKRLEDDYHTDEFRLAVYKGGLEVTPANLEAGEFSITFECMPQRFLKIGEDWHQVPYSTGRRFENPTPFRSKPLLEFYEGNTLIMTGADGTSYTVEVGDRSVGQTVVVAEAQTKNPGTSSESVQVGDYISGVRTGDPFYIDGASIAYTFSAGMYPATSLVISNESGAATVTVNGSTVTATFAADDLVFQYGTAKTVTESFTATLNTNGGGSRAYAVTLSIAWTGGGTSFTFTRTGFQMQYPFGASNPAWSIGEITAYITEPAPGHVIVDCETGEAWIENNGEVTGSANSLVTFDSVNLPQMSVGSTFARITDDGTAYVLIRPRWWKV